MLCLSPSVMDLGCISEIWGKASASPAKLCTTKEFCTAECPSWAHSSKWPLCLAVDPEGAIPSVTPKIAPLNCAPVTIHCLQLKKRLVCMFPWKRDSLNLAVLERKIILMPHTLWETQNLSTDSSHKLSTWPQPAAPPSLLCCSGKVNKKETGRSNLLH